MSSTNCNMRWAVLKILQAVPIPKVTQVGKDPGPLPKPKTKASAYFEVTFLLESINPISKIGFQPPLPSLLDKICSISPISSTTALIQINEKANFVQIGGRQETVAYQIVDLQPGHKIPGPAILIDDISTVIIEPECTAFITAGRDIRVEVGETKEDLEDLSTTECDPIQLAIFSHR